MTPSRRPRASHLVPSALLCAALIAFGSAAAAQSSAPPSAASAPALATAPATVPDPNSAAELSAVRPLLDRGLVVLARLIDMAESSSTTAYLHVNAEPSIVYDVVSTPTRFCEVTPWVVGADELSRRNGRAAYRLHLRVMSFDVDAMLTIRAIGSSIVEATLRQDSVGSGMIRWEVIPDPTGGTLLRFTVHTALDPNAFLVRLATGLSRESYIFGNIAAAVALGLHVKHSSELRAGVTGPAVRTPVIDPNEPPPRGPWIDITRHTNLLFAGLDAQGRVVQELATGATTASSASLVQRITLVDELPAHWPWVGSVHTLSRDASAVTYASRLGAPFASATGDTRIDLDASGYVLRLVGLNGGFAGERNRWDLIDRDVRFVVSSGSSVERHFTAPQRALVATDPLVGAGLSLAWRVISLRWLFAGLV